MNLFQQEKNSAEHKNNWRTFWVSLSKRSIVTSKDAGQFRPILNGKSFSFSATSGAENKFWSPVGRKNSAVIKNHALPGNFRVGICAGFSAEQNVNAHLMPAGETNCRAAAIARFSHPCWSNETGPVANSRGENSVGRRSSRYIEELRWWTGYLLLSCRSCSHACCSSIPPTVFLHKFSSKIVVVLGKQRPSMIMPFCFPFNRLYFCHHQHPVRITFPHKKTYRNSCKKNHRFSRRQEEINYFYCFSNPFIFLLTLATNRCIWDL